MTTTEVINDAVAEAVGAKERGIKRFAVEPGHGMTYSNGEPTLYGYGVYGRSSVLAGQTRRVNLGQFDRDTVPALCAAMRAAGLKVTVEQGSGYTAPNLNHLPDGPDL